MLANDFLQVFFMCVGRMVTLFTEGAKTESAAAPHTFSVGGGGETDPTCLM